MFTLDQGQLETRHNIGCVIDNHQIPFYLLMSFKNDFFIEVDGKVYNGKAGDFVLHAPNRRYAHGSFSKREGFINDWLHFTADESENEFLKSLPYDRPISNGNSKAFSRYLSEMLTEQLRNDEFSPQLISNHIYHLLTLLKRADNESKIFKSKAHQEMYQLRLHIHKNCKRQWTLEDMAKKSGYSVSHFCALYKQLFNISPIDDLLNARLEMAKKLIILKQYKISEIADLCGFSSLHYFSEFFKKKTGKTPSEY